MTQFIEFDSTWRNRSTYPDSSSFITLISSFASSNDKNEADPVCAAMPVIAWTGGQFSTLSNSLTVAATIVLDKSSDFIIVLNKAQSFQRAKNYYRGAILQFPNNIQRQVVSYRYLITGDGEFTIDTPVTNYSSLNVNLIEPSDYSNSSGLYIFVPCGSPIENFYNGMLWYNEDNDDAGTIVGYKNYIAQIDTSIGTPPLVTFDQSFSIRPAPPLETAPAFPINSTTSKIKFIIPSGVLTNGNLAHFLRNTSLKYGNAANANAQIVPRIIAWDEVNQFATVSPPFQIVPPVNTTLELLPITSFNFNPFSSSRLLKGDKAYFNVKLLSLTIPQNSNVADYPYVYVALNSINTLTVKNLLISNNPNSTLAQFRATLTSADKSNKFYKFSGDDSVQLLQINTNDALQFKIILPNGKKLIFEENEAFSPTPPNPLVQISAFFSITFTTENQTKDSGRIAQFATI